MNSKERVRAAIAREPVDKIPLGFYAVDYDTIERVIGRETFVRNRVKCRIALWAGRRDEVAQSLKEDVVEFYRKVPQCDLICSYKEAMLLPPADYEPLKPRRIDERTWEDKHGRVYQVSELSNIIACVKDPHAKDDPPTVEAYENQPEPSPPDPSVFEACDYVIEHLGADRYIAGSSGGLRAMPMLGGMEEGLLTYALDPGLVRAAIAANLRRQNAADAFMIRPGQDGVLIEEDMAASKGPLISPAMFGEFCFPALAERVASIKAHGMEQVLLHNCGNNRPIMDRFIEAGVGCYQSLQSIPDMALDGLKRDFGHAMSFWGGIPLERLIDGTPDEARAAVRDAMAKGAPGGGFILGPSHSIAKGTKYGNFMAMLDEFETLRDTC